MGRARDIANLIGGATPDIILKTSDGAILNLQTSDTTVTQNSVLGAINFQAPDEADGTDAILIASKIEAIAEGTFGAGSNATSLVFSTASSAAAGTASGKMTLTSGGELIIKDTDTADGSSPTITLQSGDDDIAQDDVLGTINFQAPDHGDGSDGILVAASISAISEGNFAADNNATKLNFKTGASEAAATKMELSSVGVLSIPADGSDLTGVTNAIHLGASADMKIFHNGGNNYILTDQASQSFTVLSDIVRFNTRDNGESLFGATLDGGFFAKFDNSTTLQTISGGVQIDGDLVFGGSGNGVNLGVTSNTDSNTLDDYEEGTFSLTMSSTTLTTTQSESQYTKIGRVVVFYIDLAISAGSDGTAFGASSMPFTADNDKDQQVNTQTSSTNTPVLFVKGSNLNSVKSNATANLSYTDVNSKFLRVNGTYQLDS